MREEDGLNWKGEREEVARDKRRLMIMGAAILFFVLVVVIIIIAVASSGKSDPETGDENSYSDEMFLPSNRMYTNDLYEGRIVIPKFAIDPFAGDLEAFQRAGDRITYQEAAMGIDVSEHQKEINWGEVKAAGVQFAIIRLGYRGFSEGGLFSDGLFKQNIEGAIANDIDVGIYFFSQATNIVEAEEEANFVLGQLIEYQEHVKYPIFFDWEFVEGENPRTANTTGEEISNCALAFCEKIKNAGYLSGFYTNKTMGYAQFDLELLKDHDFWYAEYQRDKPSFYYDFDIWQYTDSAQVEGITVPVDLNISLKKY